MMTKFARDAAREGESDGPIHSWLSGLDGRAAEFERRQAARRRGGAGALEEHAPVVDMELDPGIRRAVLILRSQGVETFESCEGGEGHAEPDPIIRFFGGTYAGYKAFAIAMEHGLPVLHLRYSYSVVNGHLEGPHWEMTFHPRVRETKNLGDTS